MKMVIHHTRQQKQQSDHNMKSTALIGLVAACKDEIVHNQCRDQCERVFMDCLSPCDTDQQCLVACMREADRCTEKCPCEAACPDGCPCPFTSAWCDVDVSCREEFEQQHQQCNAEYDYVFESCQAGCPPFDDECRYYCELAYNSFIKKCPCNQQCPDGCPCPEYECKETTTSTTTTSTTSTTTVPTTTTKKIDDQTLFTTTEALKTTTRDKSFDFSLLVLNPFHHAEEDDDYNQIEYRWGIRASGEESVELYRRVIAQSPPEYDIDRQHTCSLVMDNKMYLLGGTNSKHNGDLRQRLFEVTRQGADIFVIEQKRDLPFALDEGTCTGFGSSGVANKVRSCYS